MPRPKRYTKAQVEAQSVQATEMRVAGKSVAEICSATGLAHVTVEKRIAAWFAAHPPVGAEQMRSTVMEQYYLMYSYLSPAARAGDVDSVKASLSVLEAIRKLCGLDSPQQVEVAHHLVQPEDIELRGMISRIVGNNNKLVQGEIEQ